MLSMHQACRTEMDLCLVGEEGGDGERKNTEKVLVTSTQQSEQRNRWPAAMRKEQTSASYSN